MAVRRVLCIAPHPDDESIGAGGTLHQHAVSGDQVSILWLTSGEAAGDGTPSPAVGTRREDEAREAARLLGARVEGFWHLPDGRLDVTEDAVDRLADVLDGVDVVYAPHAGDGHQDHRAASRLVTAAVGGRDVQTWGYEIWTPIAEPVWVNDITDHIDVKREAIRAHASQVAVMAFDEAAAGLARYRAEMHCWPGQPTYAEAFASLLACSP